MPGPVGVITVNGSRHMALECELGDAAMAETACAQEELKFYHANVGQGYMCFCVEQFGRSCMTGLGFSSSATTVSDCHPGFVGGAM